MTSTSASVIDKISLDRDVLTELLTKNGDEIPFSTFEHLFKDKCNDFGFTDLYELCAFFKDIVMVEVNDSGEEVLRKTTKLAVIAENIDILLQYSHLGVAWSDLSDHIEPGYQLLFNTRLDYNSLGVMDIQDLFLQLVEQKKVAVLTNPETKEKYVMSVSMAKLKQKASLTHIVKELLAKHGGEIAFSSFEDFYKGMFHVEWNPDYYGLTDLDQLCHVLKNIVILNVNDSGDKVMKTKLDSSRQAVVIREIEEILETCPWGIRIDDLSCIECSYQLRHLKPLDYESFGVDNIEDLFDELETHGKVVSLDRTKVDDTFVMSFRLAASQHRDSLKSVVEELLRIYDGEIRFGSFPHYYCKRYKRQWIPDDYGLTNHRQLCDVLKDIVMMEVNDSGEEVIKAVNEDSKDRRPTI